MKSEKFSDALGKINLSYIEEVVNYNDAKKHKQRIWRIAAVCAAAVVLIIGITPLLNSRNDINNQFVLVAYASENNVVIKNALQEGASVPISFFETENGLKGFVFAYGKSNPKDVSSISVMTEGEFPGVINEIIGLELEKGNNYVFYIMEGFYNGNQQHFSKDRKLERRNGGMPPRSSQTRGAGLERVSYYSQDYQSFKRKQHSV